jgi:hypothetical protein
VLSTITVIHRISYTYQRTKPLPVEVRNPFPDTAASPAARTGTSDFRPAPRA